jgi:hypothetical protein
MVRYAVQNYYVIQCALSSVYLDRTTFRKLSLHVMITAVPASETSYNLNIPKATFNV